MIKIITSEERIILELVLQNVEQIEEKSLTVEIKNQKQSCLENFQ